jgi:peptidyl-prolyl cis-trans isomerase-like 4
MSVLVETSAGDLVIDLFVDECPKTCLNFLKLCKMKYYNNCLFYDVQKDYLAQTGDPSNSGGSGTSIWGLTGGDRFFVDEINPNEERSRKFDKPGLVAMANKGPNMNGSAFFISLADLKEGQMLHKRHTIFGVVAEGLDTTLNKINSSYVDPKNNRPY